MSENEFSYSHARLLSDQIWRLGRKMVDNRYKNNPLALVYGAMIQAGFQAAAELGCRFKIGEQGFFGPNGLTWELTEKAPANNPEAPCETS